MSQFHYGSITTPWRVFCRRPHLSVVSIPLWFDYNRRIVSLFFLWIYLQVSIPLWFDYNELLPEIVGLDLKEPVSIPLWFDYNLVYIIIAQDFPMDGSQFHYGSITTSVVYTKVLIFIFGLNSTMVRLQLKYTSANLCLEKVKSQFHYGSITTN